jgi:SPP1 gp7 family putative phage head morphogenesis protein
MTEFVRVGRVPFMAFDKVRPTPKSAFIRARKVEEGYARQLRKVAQHVGDIVKGLYDPAKPHATSAIDDALKRYSSTIEGWASSVGNRMVTEVAARDKAAWMEVSRRMGKGLREEIETAPTGAVLRQRLADQVKLITSLPTDAAERVHSLTLEGITQGRRASEIATEIMRSGDVSKSRATLIARTEVSRTATELTKARAQHVGSTEFVWRTAGDSDVRPSHRALNGKTFRWDQPPECDEGHHALPGAIWNCRCFADPVISLD